MIFPIAPVSVICWRPCEAMIASALSPSPFHSASKTFLAMLLEMVLSAMRMIRPASCTGLIGASAISRSSRFSRAASSPMVQLAIPLALAGPVAVTAAAK